MPDNCLNIWIFNQYASAPKYSTGAGERYFFLAKEFQKKGHQVTIFGSSFNHLFLECPSENGLFTREEIEGVTFFWVRTRKYKKRSSSLGRILSLFEFMFKLFLIPRLKLERPDVIIVSSMSMFPIIPAHYFKKRYQARKLVFEMRDLWPLTAIELAGASQRHPFIMLLSKVESFAYQKADLIISPLPLANNHVANVLGKSADQVEFLWVPNGFLPGFFSNSTNIPESIRHLFPEHQFIIGYCGALTRALTLDLAIQAIGELEKDYDIALVLLGEGDQKAYLKEVAAPFNNIYFLPKVRKSDVVSVMKNCDALYIGWKDRAIYRFGVSANKYNDYMLAGKPIISGGKIGHDPVLASGAGLSIPPEDKTALKEGILQLYQMTEEERKAMGNRGINYLDRYHNYEILAEKYLDRIEGNPM